METEVVSAIVGAFGGILGGAIAGWVTIKAKRIDQVLEESKLWVSAYETKLLELRLIEYRKLWKLTERISRRRIVKLDLAVAAALAEGLTNWYYRDGGMVLSGDARGKFFTARGSLEPDERETPDKNWRSVVVDRFSALRTALCEDINSRRGPTLHASENKDKKQKASTESQAAT